MINIVLCSDENYAAYSATVMVSALKNASNPENFRFYLLTTGLKENTEQKLKETIDNYGAELNIKNVDTTDFTSLDIDLGRFGVGTLLRLYMHKYLPEDMKKVIYLDCDLVVLGDLEALWNTNLDGSILGAVTDLHSPNDHQGKSESYFNAGVLLVDLELWKKDSIGEKCLSYLIKNPNDVKYFDQDALNHVTRKKWLSLNLSWNFQPSSYSAYEKSYNYLETRRTELFESIQKPNIVHFIGSIKPWHAKCVHPLQELFVAFSDKTPWPISIEKLRSELSILKRIKLLLKQTKIKRRRKMTKYIA